MNWSYFTWLSRQAAGGLLWFWPVTVAIVAWVTVAAVLARRRLSLVKRPALLWQLASLLIPIAVLALGTWFACENCSPSSLGQGRRYYWAMRAADGLLVVEVVVAAWLVRAATGFRLLAASFQTLVAWCSIWAAFLAGMSVSGDWL